MTYITKQAVFLPCYTLPPTTIQSYLRDASDTSPQFYANTIQREAPNFAHLEGVLNEK